MSFVVVREHKDKDGKVLSRDFYAGYAVLENRATNGLIWTNDPKQAFEFPDMMHAKNWLGGEGGGDRAGSAIIVAKDKL